MKEAGFQKASFGAGCFWGVELTFQKTDGVISTSVGYAGGTSVNPNYEDVCTGRTMHAEVVRIDFDPSVVSYESLLDVLWDCHDPTTLNQQGNDVGRHYRSIVLYNNMNEKKIIEDYIEKLNNEVYNNNIVTEVKKYEAFYKAEEYHQDYYTLNTEQPYCKLVISPKITKARKKLSKYY